MGILKELNLGQIIFSSLNPRKHFDHGKMKELADSIREKGVLQPVLVRPSNGKYELVCGERRVKAAQMIPLQSVPAIIREMDDKQVMVVQIIENLQRADIHPLEEAEGYERLLKKHGYESVDDIAAKVGKSKAYIYSRMKLCDLVAEVRQMFYAEKFRASIALLIARIPPAMQTEAAQVIAGEKKESPWGDKEPKSYREAVEYIQKHFMLQLKGAPFNVKDETLVPKAGRCSECLKRTGNQKELFADITNRADICTDPACFRKKQDAQKAQMTAEAKAKGIEVVTGAPVNKIYPYTHSDPRGYIDLHKSCDRDPKRRNYRDLLRKNWDSVPRLVVDHPDGRLREVALPGDVEKALEEAGHHFKEVKPESFRHEPSPEEKARRKAEKTRAKVCNRAAMLAIDEVLKITRKRPGRFWNLTLECLFHRSWGACIKMVCSRRGIKTEDLEKSAGTIQEDEARQIIMEIMLVGQDGPWSQWRGYGTELKLAAKQYGVDIKKMETAARKKIQQKSKGPAKRKMKMTGKEKKNAVRKAKTGR